MVNATVKNLAAVLNGGTISAKAKIGQAQNSSTGKSEEGLTILACGQVNSETAASGNSNSVLNSKRPAQNGQSTRFAEELKKIVIADCPQQLAVDLKTGIFPACAGANSTQPETNPALITADKNNPVLEQIAKSAENSEQVLGSQQVFNINNTSQIKTETIQTEANINQEPKTLELLAAEQLLSKNNGTDTETNGKLPQTKPASNPNPETNESNSSKTTLPEKFSILPETAAKFQNSDNRTNKLTNQAKLQKTPAETITPTEKQAPALRQYPGDEPKDFQKQPNSEPAVEAAAQQLFSEGKTGKKTENVPQINLDQHKADNIQFAVSQNNTTTGLQAQTAAADKADLQAATQNASKTIHKQIAESITTAVDTDTSKVSIKLNPPELGKVTLNITERNSQIDVVLQAGRPETKAQLQEAFGEITKTLSDSGLTLRQFEVKTIEPPKGGFEQSFAQSNQSQNNSPQHQLDHQNSSGANRYYISDLTGGNNLFSPETSSKNYISDTSVNLLI